MSAAAEEQEPPTVAMEPVTRGRDPQVRKENASFFFRNRTSYSSQGKFDSSIYRISFERRNITFVNLLSFVNLAFLYNLINKANLVQNLFLVYLSVSTCFGRLCAHHQGKKIVWYAHPAYQTVIHTE